MCMCISILYVVGKCSALWVSGSEVEHCWASLEACLSGHGRLGSTACLSHKLTVLENTPPFHGPRVLKQGVSYFELCLYI